MKKKRLLILSIILTIGILGFYQFNKHIKFVDLSTLSVKTDENLSKSKILIKRGSYSISRENDKELFSGNHSDWTIYDGIQNGFLKTDYGENDFLIIYDNKYYFQFRHFIFNRNHQHSYNLYLSQQQDTIYLQVNIEGEDKMQFKRPMSLISNAGLNNCNNPIEPDDLDIP